MDDRKLINGTLFVFGDGAISWLGKNQPIVTFSTSEADYIALSYAVQEAIWLQLLLAILGVIVDKPIIIKEDNPGAIAVAKEPSQGYSSKRYRHFFISYLMLLSVVTSNSNIA